MTGRLGSVRLVREVFVGFTLIQLGFYLCIRWLVVLFVPTQESYDPSALDVLVPALAASVAWIGAGWWLWRHGGMHVDRAVEPMDGRVVEGPVGATAIWVVAGSVGLGLHLLVWAGAEVFVAAVWRLVLLEGDYWVPPSERDLWVLYQVLVGLGLLLGGRRVGEVWLRWNQHRGPVAD